MTFDFKKPVIIRFLPFGPQDYKHGFVCKVCNGVFHATLENRDIAHSKEECDDYIKLCAVRAVLRA